MPEAPDKIVIKAVSVSDLQIQNIENLTTFRRYCAWIFVWSISTLASTQE